EAIQHNFARIRLMSVLDALAVLANHLDPTDAAEIGPAAAALFRTVPKAKTPDPLVVMALRRGYTAALVHLKGRERSGELAREFMAATDDLSIAALAEILAGSADRLTPADAAAGCEHLLSRLGGDAVKTAGMSGLRG